MELKKMYLVDHGSVVVGNGSVIYGRISDNFFKTYPMTIRGVQELLTDQEEGDMEKHPVSLEMAEEKLRNIVKYLWHWPHYKRIWYEKVEYGELIPAESISK